MAGAFSWLVVLCVGLVAVPIAYAGRHVNRFRFKVVTGVAAIYVATQGGLLTWIFASFRYSNWDWLHALFLPIFLGLALPILMGVLWFFTRQRYDL